jgi:hypothetical protein
MNENDKIVLFFIQCNEFPPFIEFVISAFFHPKHSIVMLLMLLLLNRSKLFCRCRLPVHKPTNRFRPSISFIQISPNQMFHNLTIWHNKHSKPHLQMKHSSTIKNQISNSQTFKLCRYITRFIIFVKKKLVKLN